MTLAAPKSAEWPALVAAVAERRDQQAFARLFDFFAPRLVSYLQRSGCGRDIAEDIAQDTMSVLWSKADLFDPGKSSLSTWLYRIARNRRVDGLRRSRIDYFDPADFAVELADPLAPVPGSALDTDRSEKILREALKNLPDHQEELIRLAFFGGLSHSEIAARVGLPLGTVKSRIRLAFARLRHALEARGVVESA